MENKLETIRQACIKANPQILELGFGCELNVYYGEDINKREAILLEKGEHIADSFPGGGEHQQDYVPYEKVWLKEPYVDCEQCLDTDKDTNWVIFEILGRPIRLADVLLAIQAGNWIEKNRTWSISTSGLFFPYEMVGAGDEWDKEMNGKRPTWNLLKDRLEDQSDETLTFLAELLK